MDGVKIMISRTMGDICSCNGCYARNYDADSAANVGKYTPVLYDVKIGSAVIRLCPDCLRVLRGEINQVIGRI